MSHDFREQLAWSQDACHEALWQALYRRYFPTLVAAVPNPTDGAGQRIGIDRWITLANGNVVRVEEKLREEHWPDVLLEYVSNDRTGATGWIEKDLQIDLLAYAFAAIRRCYFFPWPALCRAWAKNKSTWLELGEQAADGFRLVSAANAGYNSLSVAVPTKVLFRAISEAAIVQLPPDQPIKPAWGDRRGRPRIIR